MQIKRSSLTPHTVINQLANAWKPKNLSVSGLGKRDAVSVEVVSVSLPLRHVTVTLN